MKYFFVSYSYVTRHGNGFGEAYFESKEFLDLSKARESIRQSIGGRSDSSVVAVILFFTETTKDVIDHFEDS